MFNMITSCTHNRFRLGDMVAEILLLLPSDRRVSFMKVPRSQNESSHCLASYGHREGSTDVWLGSSPDEILDYTWGL